MVDTTSPAYLAGFAAGQAAGRSSLLISIGFGGGTRPPLWLVRTMPAVVLVGHHSIGPWRLVVLDATPEVETFPDLDE